MSGVQAWLFTLFFFLYDFHFDKSGINSLPSVCRISDSLSFSEFRDSVSEIPGTVWEIGANSAHGVFSYLLIANIELSHMSEVSLCKSFAELWSQIG
jgi:hypothetical protein